jgi:D-xylonolactonase
MIQTNQSSWKIISTERCILGEGILWDFRLDKLLYVDILRCRLFSLDLDSGTNRYWQFQESLCWVQLTDKIGRYILGFKSGVALFSPDLVAELKWITKSFPSNSNFRLNDSFVDGGGRIWMGSMGCLQPDNLMGGDLAMLDEWGQIIIRDTGYGVTNGPLVCPDTKKLLHSDSLSRVIYQFDYDELSGCITNKRSWHSFMAEEGAPDGMCLDDDGYVWVAMWGVGLVHKLDPQGRICKTYSLPAPNTSNVCFGGERLDRLFVTSATVDLSEEDMDIFPESGLIFEIINHGSVGRRANIYTPQGL